MDSPFDETLAPASAALSPDLLVAFAGIKKHAPRQAVEVPMADVCTVSAAVAKANLRQQAEKQRADDDAEKDKIGQMIDGAIYAGKVRIADQVFNAFVAPEDLTDSDEKVAAFKSDEAKERIKELPNWNGRAGTDYATTQALLDALKDGSYLTEGGGWFIPPRTLAVGSDAEGNQTQSNNLVALNRILVDKKLTGAFNSSSKYLTSTFRDQNFLSTVQFPKGVTSWEHKNIDRYLVRPMRLALAPPTPG